ncbi:MAG: hypothetical protein KC940_14940, partial [Candidatus Omnitrophica bacterium]|nr:hypothetical protein [Candidatus Omnitrophota bacterium]
GKLLKLGSLSELLGTEKDRVEVELKMPEGTTKESLGIQGDFHNGIFKTMLDNTEQANQFLDQWKSKGAVVRALIPQRKSLEELFVETIRAQDPKVALET